jgi:hypothetical protein
LFSITGKPGGKVVPTCAVGGVGFSAPAGIPEHSKSNTAAMTLPGILITVTLCLTCAI